MRTKQLNFVIIDTINEYKIPWIFEKIEKFSGIELLIRELKKCNLEIILISRSSFLSTGIKKVANKFSLKIINGMFYQEIWNELFSKMLPDNLIWIQSHNVFTKSDLIKKALEYHIENKNDYTIGNPSNLVPDIIVGNALQKTHGLPKVFPKNYSDQFKTMEYSVIDKEKPRRITCWRDYFQLKLEISEKKLGQINYAK